MSIIDVNEQSLFEEVVCHDGLLLLACSNFKARNATPLRAIMNELSQRYGFAVRFCQINTANNPTFSQTVAISHNPTFLLMRNGRVIDERNGFMSQDELEVLLENNL